VLAGACIEIEEHMYRVSSDGIGCEGSVHACAGRVSYRGRMWQYWDGARESWVVTREVDAEKGSACKEGGVGAEEGALRWAGAQRWR
jgi:hypothetical protein